MEAIADADRGDTALQSANGRGVPAARIASATVSRHTYRLGRHQDGHDQVGLQGHLLQRWDVEETRSGRQVPGALAPAGEARYDAVPVLHQHFPDAVAHVSRAQNRNRVKPHSSAS